MTAESEPPGRLVLAGRYRVDGLLGRGGMSEVFHGYDERLDRRVAIKILRPKAPGSIPAAPDSPEAAEILDALERDRSGSCARSGSPPGLSTRASRPSTTPAPRPHPAAAPGCG